MTPQPSSLIDARRNRLLAELPDADWQRWQPQAEAVALRSGQVLCEAGARIAHIYFPVSAVVSLLLLTQEGASAEIAVVGHDGAVGVSLVMGGESMPTRAVVQSSGLACRVPVPWVRDEVQQAGAALGVLLRYTQALMGQVAQTAACNRYHSVDQLLCRRLLAGLDRSSSDELEMTQEGVAQLLGVRREGVTAAAMRLQQAGVIRYRRGHIAVLDRGRLEQLTCEHHAAVAEPRVAVNA